MYNLTNAEIVRLCLPTTEVKTGSQFWINFNYLIYIGKKLFTHTNRTRMMSRLVTKRIDHANPTPVDLVRLYST